MPQCTFCRNRQPYAWSGSKLLGTHADDALRSSLFLQPEGKLPAPPTRPSSPSAVLSVISGRKPIVPNNPAENSFQWLHRNIGWMLITAFLNLSASSWVLVPGRSSWHGAVCHLRKSQLNLRSGTKA